MDDQTVDKASLKIKVASYWNQQPCGTDITSGKRFTREYFEEIEQYRYEVAPEVFSFAQFTRYQNQKVLEIGIGAGTDFIQWVRAGAIAYGIDLTEEAVEHVKNRLLVYGLSAKEVRVADAENLPYEDHSFDLVYSWGVIHHSPDTLKALAEIIRCTKPGGSIKIMVYNRRSVEAFYKYLTFGLFKGKPFRSISDILFHNMESIGTKAFTISEVKNFLSQYPVDVKRISAQPSRGDLLSNESVILRLLAYTLACLLGFDRCGWFMTMELKKQ